MKRFDIYLIIGGMLLAGVLYFSGILRPTEPGQKVVVYYDGEEVYSAPLSLDDTFTYESGLGTNKIEISGGKVKMVFATCPDQYCVNHSEISKAAETIICLPNKIVAEIEGGEETNVDSATN